MRGLISDEERAFLAPFLVRTGAHNGRPPSDHRLILDAIFWIARTEAPWRDLDARFGKWSNVYRRFRRWTIAGVRDVILEALDEGGPAGETVQMIDGAILRAHRHSAGAKKGDSREVLRVAISAVLVAASRPGSTSGRTASACPSGSSRRRARPPTRRATVH